MPMRTDRELLADYAATASEAAFAELAARHGPMIFRTCLRCLGNEADAEDAAQAVFLVLVRKRKALRSEGELAAWLHRVAKNVAHLAARGRVRRSRHEEAAAMVRAADSGGEGREARGESGRDEALALLDRELDRLPAEQRQAVVLRYLEGRTQEEAARLMSCPQGTLARRATIGLERLRERLCQRGNVLSAAALAGLLGAEAKAVLPASLLPSILAASKLAAAGAAAGAAGTTATVLADGVMKAMLIAKLKVAVVVAAAVLAVGGGGGAVAAKLLAAEPVPPKIETAAQDNTTIKCVVTGLPGGGKVTLDAGSEQGLKPGFELDVERDGKKVAVVKVVSVEPKTATAELVSATGELKVGDKAATRFREVAQTPPPTAKDEWGKESNGLVASLRAKKTQFAIGEAMEFEVVVKNISDKELAIYDGAYAGNWPLSYGKWRWRSLLSGKRASASNLSLKPGEAKSLNIFEGGTLGQFVWTSEQLTSVPPRDALPEGVFQVKATYNKIEGQLPPGTWTGQLETNAVEIKVGPAAGEAVNGLKLTLSAEKTELKLAPADAPSNVVGHRPLRPEAAKLRVSFANVGEKPIKLDVYGSGAGAIKIIWTGRANEGSASSPGKMPDAGGPVMEPGKGFTYPPVLDDFVFWSGDVKPGEYRVKIAYECGKGRATGCWTGTVTSNEIVIKVLPPEGAGAEKPPAAGAPDEATARRIALEWVRAFPDKTETADWGQIMNVSDGGAVWNVVFERNKPGRLLHPSVNIDKRTGAVKNWSPGALPGLPKPK